MNAIDCYIRTFYTVIFNFQTRFAVNFECRVIFKYDKVILFYCKPECCFFLCPQAFFSLCDCDCCRNICVSVVNDHIVLFSLNCVRFYELRDCYFLLINQIACQLQNYIAFECRVSNQLKLECYGRDFVSQFCVNIVKYSLFKLEVYMAAFLVSIPESITPFCIVNFVVVIAFCCEEVFSTVYCNVCYINTFRQFKVKAFSHGPCAGECFFCCYFQRHMVAVVCDTIVVNINAAVDYRYIFVFIYGKNYFVINNLCNLYCCSCRERVCICCIRIISCGSTTLCHSFDCDCACSTRLSCICLDFDVVLINDKFVFIYQRGYINNFYIQGIVIGTVKHIFSAAMCIICCIAEYKALGKLQFKPLIVVEITNCGLDSQIAVKFDLFFFRYVNNFSCRSGKTSATDGNIYQIVYTAAQSCGANGYCCLSACACFVQNRVKVEYNDIVLCKSACKSVSNLIVIFVDYFNRDLASRRCIRTIRCPATANITSICIQLDLVSIRYCCKVCSKICNNNSMFTLRSTQRQRVVNPYHIACIIQANSICHICVPLELTCTSCYNFQNISERCIIGTISRVVCAISFNNLYAVIAYLISVVIQRQCNACPIKLSIKGSNNPFQRICTSCGSCKGCNGNIIILRCTGLMQDFARSALRENFFRTISTRIFIVHNVNQFHQVSIICRCCTIFLCKNRIVQRQCHVQCRFITGLCVSVVCVCDGHLQFRDFVVPFCLICGLLCCSACVVNDSGCCLRLVLCDVQSINNFYRCRYFALRERCRRNQGSHHCSCHHHGNKFLHGSHSSLKCVFRFIII